MTAVPLYVYAVVPANHPADTSALRGLGSPPGRVWRIDGGRVAAVVGDAPAQLRAKRRDLIAHQQVLERLAESGAVLPMRFGMLTQDERSLRATLEGQAEGYLRTLAELDGRVEMNVKLTLAEEPLLRAVAREDPEVRRLRAGGGTYADRLALGEAVSAAVSRREQEAARSVTDTLRPHAVQAGAGPPVAGIAANVSFLVDRSVLARFESAAADLATTWSGRGEVRVTGPLPAYTFVADEEVAS